jgi:hypothetical protein
MTLLPIQNLNGVIIMQMKIRVAAPCNHSESNRKNCENKTKRQQNKKHKNWERLGVAKV